MGRESSDEAALRSLFGEEDGTEPPPHREGASEGNLVGIVAGPATVTSTRLDVTYGLDALRALPLVPPRGEAPPHPLRLFIDARGVTVKDAARHLGVSERLLFAVLARRRRFLPWRERQIASGLGLDVDNLFPPDET